MVRRCFVEGITHRKSSNESVQDYKTISDLTTTDRNCIERLIWNKKGLANCQAHPIKVNIWRCFSSKDFGLIVCFTQNLNAELMCDICKRGLLPTA